MAAMPVITDIVPPGPGTYGVASRPAVTVVFSEPVNVTGSPSIAVRIGAVDRAFTNGFAVREQNAVTFTYAPQTGDNGSLTITGPIRLDGGTIKGDDGSDAALSFPAEEAPGVIFDTVPPAAPFVNAVTPASPRFDQPFTVTGTAEPGSRVYVGTADARTLFNSLTDANGNWSVAASPQPAGTYTWEARATDHGGSSPPTSFTFTVQHAPPTPGVPTITRVGPPAAGTYNAEYRGFVLIHVQFSEPVIVTGSPVMVTRIGSTTTEFRASGGTNSDTVLFGGSVPWDREGTLSITGPLLLNGGTIRGHDGDDASLSFTPVEAPEVFIDSILPAAPVINGVSPASPTSEQSFTSAGTAEPGATVHTTFPENMSAPVNVDGNWWMTFPPRAEGTYTFFLYTTDPAGNDSHWQRAANNGVPVSITVQPTPTGRPTITSQPQSYAATEGSTVTFSTATSAANATFQWHYNGAPIANATGSTLIIENATPQQTGLYTAVVTESGAFTVSNPAILGLASNVKVVGPGTEVLTDVVHPNGNIYDQVLPGGAALTVTANPQQVTRTSWVDLSGDIIQAEFSGAGSLSIVLAVPSGPAVAENYNQPDVAYMRGHAGLVITGADETTNVAVFSVGRITAVDQSLFREGVDYHGVADLAFIAIASANGSFGGVYAGNANFWSTRGSTGIHAPGVRFNGPVNICEITATEEATPVILLGAVTDAHIAGGDLAQTNGRAVQVSGLTKLRFVAGMTSHGRELPALICQGRLEENGSDVTAKLVSP